MAPEPDSAMTTRPRSLSRTRLARRLFGNYLLQVINLGLRLLDQLLLIPLYLYAWGTDLYRDWLVLTALVWFLTSCSFGTEEYFANVFLRSAAAGNHVALERQVRIGLFVSSMISLLVLGLLYTVVLTGKMSHLFGFATIDEHTATLVLLIMTIPLWCWFQTMLLHGVYRAFGDFSRGEAIYAIYFVVQLVSVAAALALKQSPLVIAFCYALGPVLCAGITIIDVRRRYLGTRLGFAIPSRAEWRQIVPQSLMYFSNTLSVPLTQQGPLLIFGLFGFSASAVVTFNVCRVFTGLTRMIGAQCFAIGSGIEMARQHVLDEREGCRQLYADSGRVVACLAGALAGFSIPFGGPFITLWTHGTVAADTAMIVSFLLAICLSAPGRPALMLLGYTNNARAIGLANGLYAVGGLLLSLALAGPWGPLGVAVALSLGETIGIGLCPPVIVALRFGFGATRYLTASYFAGACVLALSYVVAQALFWTAQLGAVEIIERTAAWTAIMALPTILFVLPHGHRLRWFLAVRRLAAPHGLTPTR
jgi:O-antigen/teichoic acid export membrane protein